MESKSVLSKEEAVKEISRLISEAGKLMGEATRLADQHNISYEFDNFETDDDEDYVVDGISSLAQWNSSNCW